MIARLHRHALLQVNPDCWPQVLARAADNQDNQSGEPAEDATVAALLAGWARSGWPVVVRRFLTGESREIIPVALSLPPLPPLPPRAGRTLQVRGEELAGTLAAVPLEIALSSAPPAWRPVIERLCVLGDDCGSTPELYGSLLWQALTGLRYLTAHSDLDVCWPVTHPQQAQRLVNQLTRIERASPVRIDGELRLPDGAGVSWREFTAASESDEVLVKTLQAVSSRPRAALFAHRAAA